MAKGDSILALSPLDVLQGGVRVESLRLTGEKPLVIGRAVEADWSIPDAAVSREHARIEPAEAVWHISDMGSRHGTFVNGRRLEHGERMTLHPGDVVAFGHWRCLCEHEHRLSTGHTARDQDEASKVSAVQLHSMGGVAQSRLEALMAATQRLASAASRVEIAQIVCDSAAQGTGCGRVLVAQLLASDAYDIIARSTADRAVTLSRSLLRSASAGQVVQLEGERTAMGTHSLIDLKIRTAICAALMASGAPDCFLYLDTRDAERDLPADAAAYCAALANVGGLAIERILSTEMAARRLALERDLEAAHQARELLLPARTGARPGLVYAFDSIAGRHVAGDLFDVIPLGPTRTAFFLGDVSGKGVAAGVLMAAIQAQLRSLLVQGADLAAAMSAANADLSARGGATRFVTLLAGVWDAASGALELTDAGHGYCGLCEPGNAPRGLSINGGLPLGIEPASRYATSTFHPAGDARLVLFSDGLVEQPSRDGREFGVAAALSALKQTAVPHADVESLIGAVRAHAGGPFADDLTVASLKLNLAKD